MAHWINFRWRGVDHLYKLDRIIQGDLEELFDAVHVWFQAEAMKNAGL